MQFVKSNKQVIFLLAIILAIPIILFLVMHPTSFKNFAANETDGINEQCGSNGACMAGLVCVTNLATNIAHCLPPKDLPSGVQTGLPGTPCSSNGTCAQGSTCSQVANGYFCVFKNSSTKPAPTLTAQQLLRQYQTNAPATSTPSNSTPNTQTVPTTSANPPRQLYQGCSAARPCATGLTCNYKYGATGYCVSSNTANSQ